MRPSTQTTFRDVTLSLALVFAVVFLLPHRPEEAKKTESETRSPGTVTGEIVWPDDMNVDIDLWFRGPDGVAVGFNNLGSPTANLLRDDLGRSWDFLPINHEIIATRGAPPGEYQFNVHYYRGDVSPVPVLFTVTKRGPHEYARQEIVSKRVELKFMTQEITVVRFMLDKNGNVVVGSVGNIHRPIAKTSGGENGSGEGREP